MEDAGRDRLRTMLSELLDHMEDAGEVASGIAQKYPEYETMAEAVRTVTEMVAMAKARTMIEVSCALNVSKLTELLK